AAAEQAPGQSGRPVTQPGEQASPRRPASSGVNHARHAPNDTRFSVVTGEARLCRSIYVYVIFCTEGWRPVPRSPAAPLPPPEERRRLRASGALTQAQVAARLRVSRETVRAWESGRTAPRGRNRQEYAKLLAELAELADPAGRTRPEAPPAAAADATTPAASTASPAPTAASAASAASAAPAASAPEAATASATPAPAASAPAAP